MIVSTMSHALVRFVSQSLTTTTVTTGLHACPLTCRVHNLIIMASTYMFQTDPGQLLADQPQN